MVDQGAQEQRYLYLPESRAGFKGITAPGERWSSYRWRRHPGGVLPYHDLNMSSADHQVTQLLRLSRDGDAGARDKLLSLVYDELRSLARSCFRGEAEGHTLQPTALVNEVCLRFLADGEIPGENRNQLRAFAATAMRHVLIDYARRKHRLKRGGDHQRVPLESGLQLVEEPAVDLVALDEAMERLAELDPRKVQVVELRYFAGFSVEETAACLSVSPATVKRDWDVARAWLETELSSDGE